MAMATSGLTGFFGWTALTAMVNAIAHATGEEDEWDLKAATHQALRDAYGEGVADAIVNGPMPSVGKRVAPDVVRMWIPDSDIDMEERGWGANALQQLMGPVVGGLIFGSVPEAVTLAAKGEEYRAAERASPKFLRDILKAIRYHEEGVRSLVGERDLVHDTSAMEEIMQAMGVSPFEVQKKYERNSRFYGDLEAIRRDKQKLLIQVKDRMREGEAVPSGVQEDIDKFNRKVSKLGLSDMVINNRTIRESIKSSKRRSKDMIDGAYVPDNQREFYEKNYR
jgi:hypothetical protein